MNSISYKFRKILKEKSNRVSIFAFNSNKFERVRNTFEKNLSKQKRTEIDFTRILQKKWNQTQNLVIFFVVVVVVVNKWILEMFWHYDDIEIRRLSKFFEARIYTHGSTAQNYGMQPATTKMLSPPISKYWNVVVCCQEILCDHLKLFDRIRAFSSDTYWTHK